MSLPKGAPHRSRALRVSYDGRRHARLTRSMKQLEPALQKVLVHLRYELKDGESAALSNRAIAEATGLSESYVSVLVRQLAGETITIRSRGRALVYPATRQPFIERVWQANRGDGVAGFVITMLPPPELRPHASAAGPNRNLVWDHAHDPIQQTAFEASDCAVLPQSGDHAHDPCILLSIHTCESINQPCCEVQHGEFLGLDGDQETCASIPARDSHNHATGEDQSIPEQLDPLVAQSHQMLNPDRTIFPGEWREILSLQQVHQAQTLLIWQARASRSKQKRVLGVTPDYYRACATQEHLAIVHLATQFHPPAVEAIAGHTDLASPPNESDAGAEAETLAAKHALLDAIEQKLGEPIQKRRALLATSLELLQAWHDQITHRGLQTRFVSPAGFLVREVLAGKQPPSTRILEHWAAQAPALRPQELQAAYRQYRTAIEHEQQEAIGHEQPAPTLPEHNEPSASPRTAGELIEQLRYQLRLYADPIVWSLIDRLAIQITGETFELVCPPRTDRQLADQYLLPAAHMLLRSIGSTLTPRIT